MRLPGDTHLCGIAVLWMVKALLRVSGIPNCVGGGLHGIDAGRLVFRHTLVRA
jgi:hypothetical protein